MKKRTSFILFPYLRTSEPARIGDVIFRSSEDTAELSKEQKSKLGIDAVHHYTEMHCIQLLYSQESPRPQSVEKS